MDSMYLDDFIAEVLESFAEVEPYLLELEVDCSGAKSDLFSRLFQTAHILKNGAGFFDLEEIGKLSYLLEVSSGMLRDGFLAADETICRKIIRGFTLLANHTVSREALSSPLPDGHEECESALLQLIQEGFASERKNSLDESYSLALADGQPLFTINGYDLDSCRKEGTFIYVLEFDLDSDLKARDISPVRLLHSLQKSGYVLDNQMDSHVDTHGGLRDDQSRLVYFLYASILDEELIKTVFSLPAEKVYSLSIEMLVEGGSGWLKNSSVEEATDSISSNSSKTDIDDLLEQYDLAMEGTSEDGAPAFEPWDGTLDSESADVLESFSAVVPPQDSFDSAVASLQNGTGESAEKSPPTPSLDEETSFSLGDDFTGEELSENAPLTLTDSDDISSKLSYESSSASVSAELTDDERMELLEAELDAAILAEAESAGIEAELPSFPILPSFDKSAENSISPAPLDNSILELDDSATVSVPPSDDDLFFDAGNEPDMSHLDIEEPAVSSDAGVLLDLVSSESTEPTGSKTERNGFAIYEADSKVRVVIEGDQTIGHIHPLKELLLDLMQEYLHVSLDVEALERVDVTFVQLIVAAQKTAEERGVSFALEGKKSVGLEEVLDLCGLDIENSSRIPLAGFLYQ